MIKKESSSDKLKRLFAKLAPLPCPIPTIQTQICITNLTTVSKWYLKNRAIHLANFILSWNLIDLCDESSYLSSFFQSSLSVGFALTGEDLNVK